MELESSRPAGRAESDAEFLEKIESFKQALGEVQANTRSLERLHSAALLNINEAENAANQRALDACVDRTDAALQWCRNQLKALSVSKSSFPPGTPPYALRSNQVASVTRQLREAVTTYRDVQERYKARYWEKAERQFRIVRPTATDAEIRAALSSAQSRPGALSAFTQDLVSSGATEARRAMDEAVERWGEVGKLERSIADLAQLFQDLTLLLDAQDAQITAAEYNVEETVTLLEEGNREVATAKGIRINTRKNLWILTGICALIIIIIIIILIVQFRPK
ncbi:t-SNARE [Gonapodya prolifera JEL478]|uniref:t-SNARE n=1 Tax=Gonapodya prolifera (strain JEL478) TaxID=1344416 RepID=A0A139A5Q7_GONPJ|nr:t-SNARE [Gonapodya prolifera JEL478]|eukprot:KXS11979.1 t-SNARE [Gonapodya prolifera JEL478]